MLRKKQKEASEASELDQAIEKNNGTPSTTALCRARDGNSVRTREEDLAHTSLADSYPQAAPSGAMLSLK